MEDFKLYLSCALPAAQTSDIKKFPVNDATQLTAPHSGVLLEMEILHSKKKMLGSPIPVLGMKMKQVKRVVLKINLPITIVIESSRQDLFIDIG